MLWSPRTTMNRLANRLSSAQHKKGAVIALDAGAKQVSIIGMFYGGQGCERILQGDSEDGTEH
jgi:hypothetical protein